MGNLFSRGNYNNTFQELKTVKSEYFPLINKMIRNNYDEGLNEERMKKNMSICLDQKCFDEIIEQEDTANIPYIYWLDYLYNYLSQEQSDREWAAEMIQELDEEPFLTENKYLSHFFFKEFYFNNQPKCIKDSKEDDAEANSDISDEMLYGNNEIDLRTSMNTSNLNMMRNLGGTFMVNCGSEGEVDSNSSSQENDVEKKYKSFRNKVKKYIYIFKEHIVYKDHPINKVIQIFEKIWVKYVEEKIKFLDNFNDSENNNYNLNATVDELTRDLQNFVIKMQICLKLFYCKTIDLSCFFNEKDELMNLLTTLVFRTGRIYETIFKLQKIKLKANSDDMNNKYLQLTEITPQQVGIEKQFCLNEETYDMQESILEREQKDMKVNSKKKKKKNNEEEDKQNINIDDNAITYLYINETTDKIMDERKVNSLLVDIRNKKAKLQNYIENDSNNMNMKVNIDFDDENNSNLLNSDENSVNKIGSLNDESRMGSILPITRMSLDKILQDDIQNLDEEGIHIKGNIFKTNTNDYNDNDKCLIVRDNNEYDKTVTPFTFIKVFNRISFYKDADPDKSDYVSLPYETAIHLLKQIEKYKAPFEKMLIFASLGNEIKNCIDDFWKDMEDYIEKDLLAVEAEQLMTIFIYIISKARIKDILIHCKLIQLFTTSMTKSSMIGYYYSNAEASVTFIQSLKSVEELMKGKNNIFKNDNNIKNKV